MLYNPAITIGYGEYMKYTKTQISDVFKHLKQIDKDSDLSKNEVDDAISLALNMIQPMLDLMIELDPDMEHSSTVREPMKNFIAQLSILTNNTLPRMNNHSKEYASIIDILSEGDSNGWRY